MKKIPVALSLLAAATFALGACDDAGDEPVDVPATTATTTAPEPDPEVSTSVSVSPSPSKSVSVKPSASVSVSPSVVSSPDSEGDGPNT